MVGSPIGSATFSEQEQPNAIKYVIKLALMVVACLRIVNLIGNSGAWWARPEPQFSRGHIILMLLPGLPLSAFAAFPRQVWQTGQQSDRRPGFAYFISRQPEASAVSAVWPL